VNENYLDRALSNFTVATFSGSLGGGIGAVLQGGNFWQGAMYGAQGAAMGYSIYATATAPGWKHPLDLLKRLYSQGAGIAEPYDSQINDNKFGHANAMTALLHEFGPLVLPLLFVGGLGYELYSVIHPGHVPGAATGQPVGFFGHVFDGQNPVNWLWDTPGDILANGLGLVNGVLFSPSLAVEANKFGYLIPGPDYSSGRVSHYPELGGDQRQLWLKFAPPGVAWPW